jgi:Flp pilus assembly protein TadD
LADRGEVREGLKHIQKAIELKPDHAEALYDAGQVEEALGNATLAIEHYRRAMDVRIGWPEPANNLAMILATHPDEEIRDGEEAVRCAKIACEISADEHPDPIFLDTLAAAYAEADRFDEAVETSSLAINLFEARGGGKRILDGMRARLELYKNGQPYRVAPRQSAPK